MPKTSPSVPRDHLGCTHSCFWVEDWSKRPGTLYVHKKNVPATVNAEFVKGWDVVYNIFVSCWHADNFVFNLTIWA